MVTSFTGGPGRIYIRLMFYPYLLLSIIIDGFDPLTTTTKQQIYTDIYALTP